MVHAQTDRKDAEVGRDSGCGQAFRPARRRGLVDRRFFHDFALFWLADRRLDPVNGSIRGVGLDWPAVMAG